MTKLGTCISDNLTDSARAMNNRLTGTIDKIGDGNGIKFTWP